MSIRTTAALQWMPPATGFAMVFAIVFATGCADTVEFHDASASHILFDNSHCDRGLPDEGLDQVNYGYRFRHGFRRLFSAASDSGFEWQRFSRSTINAKLLDDVDILFIGLVDENQADFELEEIEAIEKFVQQGGGLFVITDHSNCYHHAERINPLLRRFGFTAALATACDRGADNTLLGNGWLWSTTFSNHAIVEDLEAVSMQTGGSYLIDPEFTAGKVEAIAFTSPDGWADTWDANNEPESGGFYGNWIQDPGEQSGPLPIVIAAEFGKGKVVAVGDQNILGDLWLGYGNNFELGLRSLMWLSHAQAPLAVHTDALDKKLSIYIADGPSNHLVAQKKQSGGMYTFFAQLNRDADNFARAGRWPQWSSDVVVFTGLNRSASAQSRAAINTDALAYLTDGGIILLALSTPATSAEVELVYTLMGEAAGADALLANQELEQHSLSDRIDELAGPMWEEDTEVGLQTTVWLSQDTLPLVQVFPVNNGHLALLTSRQIISNRFLGEIDEAHGTQPWSLLVKALMANLKKL